MRKRIAVFICAISLDNQKRVAQGIIKRAKECDVDVFIFTCHMNYNENEECKEGAYNIVNLPDLTDYAGVVIMRDSIQYEKAANHLVERILKSHVPAVSIDEQIPGMFNIQIENYASQKEIVRYLIEEKGFTKINYVTGLLSNWEGQERYQAYQDAMREHGLPIEEERIFRGQYDAWSGREAVLKFAKDVSNLPEAIVFANDAMAIAGIEQLQELGIRVPEDVCVTGFDNDETSKLYSPSLTTVDRRQNEMGRLAVDYILSGKRPEDIFLKSRVIFRESTGTFSEADLDELQKIKRKYLSHNSVIQQVIDAIKRMSTDLAGLGSLEELYEKFKLYVNSVYFHSFYLCMCDIEKTFCIDDSSQGANINLDHVNTQYTRKVTVPVAFKENTFYQIPSFMSQDVLPRDETSNEDATCYIVMPINYRNICFGYCVTDDDFSLESELSFNWVANLGIALENVRKWMMLDQVVKKLNSVWKYDALTGLYNRSGFYGDLQRLLPDYREEQKNIGILFLDLDGLKQTNDTLGHECGDAFIKEMASVLKETTTEEQLVMRYGGDEFVILLAFDGEDCLEKLQQDIQRKIKEHNSLPNRRYCLQTSIGSYMISATSVNEVNLAIEQADAKMYEEKRQKKTRN